MKKKIGELTLNEVSKICEKAEICLECPIAKYINGCTGILTPEEANKEVKVSE